MTPSLSLFMARTLAAGSLGSVFSAIALMARGRRDAASAAAPVNAVSHWFWDREALRQQAVDVRHTLVGYLTHHGASLFWAALFSWALRTHPQAAARPAAVLAASAATSAVACFVDFNLTPERLTPGYEHRLSRRSLAVVYLAFGAGLAVGALAVGRRRRGAPAR